MSKHTPGPWKVSGNSILAPWGEEIAFMAEVDGDVKSEQSANAHLIAAAPEMLESLQALAFRAVMQPEDEWVLKKALEVIAKAEGSDAA